MLANNKCNNELKEKNTNPYKVEFVPKLYKAISLLETKEECENFFNVLANETTLRTIEQRYEVAYLLSKGASYDSITNKTGASSATIRNVSSTMIEGNGAYEYSFELLEENGIEEEWLKKHPGYFDDMRNMKDITLNRRGEKQ